jgi:hypothetical protein
LRQKRLSGKQVCGNRIEESKMKIRLARMGAKPFSSFGNRSFVLPVKTVALPTNEIFVGAMELARLAFTVIFATADFLDHHGSLTRCVDSFD